MRVNHYLKTVTAALALAASASVGWAQSGSTNNPNTFDTAASTASFIKWWGLSGLTMTWTNTPDAQANPNSGSVQYFIPFTGAGGDQIMTFFTIANRWGWDQGTVIDATTYTNFHFDIKVDPSSAITAGGNYGNMECGLVTYYWGTTNYLWGTIALNYGNIPLSATNWTSVNKPLNPAAANIDRVVGFYFKMWSNGAHTNTVIWNLDNVGIQKPYVEPVIPPPTLTLQKSVAGHAFIAASGGQYDRQNIRTVGSNYSWIGASGPVSYSMDIAKHTDVSGCQVHMYLVPGAGDPTRPDCDWHENSVLMWRVAKNGDGSAWSSLSFKTNAPDSNGHLYDTGGLGGLGNPKPEGKWTLTFNNNTDVTITGPDGAKFTTNIPPDAISVFNQTPAMQIAVGMVPGDLARVGQKAILKGVQITGTPGQADVNTDLVSQALDPNVWFINASSPTYGVQWVPTTSPLWLSWTLPDRGFNLQSRATMNGGAWASPTLGGFEANNNRYILLQQTDLPGANAGYFRMLKRVGTKLQVLMPGETAAPGTPTGKTGSPPPMKAGETSFDLVVNLVDDNWYKVTSPNDEVSINASIENSCWSPAQNAYLPINGTMVNGTATFTGLQWIYAGDITITATNVSRPTILPNTSSPVTVSW